MDIATGIAALFEKFGAAVTICVILAGALVYVFRLWREDVKNFAVTLDALNRERLAEQKKATEDVLTGLNASTNTTTTLAAAMSERNATLNKQNEMLSALVLSAERDRPYWQDRFGRLENVTANIKDDTGEVRRGVNAIVQNGQR